MATKAKRPLRIVIVGAGIGGLAAACALCQRGFAVAVFERAEKLEEVGAGLQIGPNGVRVLRVLGLGDALRRNAFEPTDMVSLKWDDASLRFREPMRGYYLEKFGVPYMTAHRADIHAMLREAAGAVPLRLGARALAQYDDVDAALAAYVAARQPRTARVILQSRQQFANNRKVPPPPFLDRSWIFSFDVTHEEGALQPV